ncbi:hypothetical protein NEPAR04_1440 [Nematocida parisii]|nr:hypothetical protein NEPAR08_1415 [Nematocida parisii]KAI5129190.1 hypothetical protein NEPAR03_1590 [Nematocida parisii]KAI5142084.1 hypothetical protein NEPAR04_1440 [Nematocida parisii]
MKRTARKTIILVIFCLKFIIIPVSASMLAPHNNTRSIYEVSSRIRGSRNNPLLHENNQINQAEENIRHKINELRRGEEKYNQTKVDIAKEALSMLKKCERILPTDLNRLYIWSEGYDRHHNQMSGQDIEKQIVEWQQIIPSTYNSIYTAIEDEQFTKNLLISPDGANTIKYKLNDLPILTPRIEKYYSKISADLKNIILLSKKAESKYDRKEYFVEDNLDRKALANCFVSLVYPPYIFTTFSMYDILLKHGFPNTYVERGLLDNSGEQVGHFINNIDKLKLKLINFFGFITTQISKSNESNKKFVEYAKKLHKQGVNIYKTVEKSVDPYGNIEKKRQQYLHAWRLINNSFSLQVPIIIELLKNILHASECNLKELKYKMNVHTDGYILNRKDHLEKLNKLAILVKGVLSPQNGDDFNESMIMTVNSANYYLTERIIDINWQIVSGLHFIQIRNNNKNIGFVELKKQLTEDIGCIWKISTIVQKYINSPEFQPHITISKYAKQVTNNLIEVDTKFNNSNSIFSSIISGRFAVLLTLCVSALQKALLFGSY